MCKRLEADQAQIFLETLCASPDTPQTTLLALASVLIRHVISSNDTQTSRRILGNLNQRRPAVVKQAARQLSCNEELKSSVDQLMLALTIPISGVPSATKSDLLLAVNSFDENEFIHNALLLRLLDSEASVIEVLYSKPAVIIPVILANFSTYLSTLTAAICTEDPGSKSKPKRTLIRLHLAFAASNLCPSAKDSAVTEKIFHALFVPFLLYSKPRQRTTESVWEILDQSKSDGKDEWMLWKYEWLSGSLDIWEAGKDVGKDAEQQDTMSALNLALANKISESIMISNRFEDHLDMLTTHMCSANPHVRVLAHLLSRSLLARLSGEHLFIAASKIIKGMDIDDPIENAWYGIDKPTETISDDAIGRALFAKPSSQNTLRLLQISILALLATAPRPVNATVDWFNSAPVTSGDTRGQRYVEHIHSIYHLANLYVPVAFTIHILSLLFINLDEQSLAFLASIWLLEPALGADKDRYNQLRLAALRHGAAFLEAHQDDPSPVDFQTILPSLLIATQSSNLNVRRAAVDCIIVLSKSTARPFTSIYAMDWIYGKETDKLQFVDQSDLKKYLDSLAEDHEHLVHDESFAQIFHERHLGVHGGKKKQVEYRRRILCFLLSHVVSLAAVQAKVNLLKLIRDDASLQEALPIRRLSILFSSVSLPTSLDYIVTAAGISSLPDDNGPKSPPPAVNLTSTPDVLYSSQVEPTQSQLAPLDIGFVEDDTSVPVLSTEDPDSDWEQYWKDEDEFPADFYDELDLQDPSQS
ncbi:hypothetical protein ONZ45_g19349 [Pleurotus djamor]|nr:hypothetical protein ONZ45_g19349 [Pleurotus djamor]